MAGIDKCYTSLYDDYRKFIEWSKTARFKTPRGVSVCVYDYTYEYWTKDEMDEKDRPICNTPSYVDAYLYNNCPFQFIKDWLKEVYSGQGYCKGIPSELEWPLKGPGDYKECSKVKVTRRGGGNHPVPGRWWIEIVQGDHDWYYNRDYDFWKRDDEEEVWTSSCMVTGKSVKSVIRKILRKWKLPAGCSVRICGRYLNDVWILKTK